jgi:hypothetical protein
MEHGFNGLKWNTDNTDETDFRGYRWNGKVIPDAAFGEHLLIKN